MAEEDDIPCFLRGLDYIAATCISVFVKFIISLLVFICLASLLVWMMLRSNAVKFHVHNAQLSQFDLDFDNNNLLYNLSLNFSIRNSNTHMGIHYDKFEATISYTGQRLASVFVPSFYQGHKTTIVLETVFQGQNLVLLGEDDRRKLDDDRKLGVYGIDVKLRIKSRVLFAHIVTWPMKPSIRCHLKLPLGSSGGFKFEVTKCHLHF